MIQKYLTCFCRTLAVLLLLSCFIFLYACTVTETVVRETYVSVIVVDGENYSAEQPIYSVKRGDDIAVTVTLDNGYAFGSCDYDGTYSVDAETDEVTISLLNVRYDTRIAVSAFSVSGIIRYYLNGGQLIEGSELSLETGLSDGGEYYISYVDTTHHVRYNTDIADEIERPGYTQLGWNTAADGSGEHIGLGSRVTVDGSAIFLYAEWVKWTDADLFTWRENTGTDEEGDIELTGYGGPTMLDSFVIPAEIDGQPVTSIARSFAEGMTVQTLVFPNTLWRVRANAFTDCSFEEIYFFDNLEEITDGGLNCIIPTVHINAVWSPRYSTGNDLAQFAEDMDRMILNADNKKMIFYAGCSMSYGLNSEVVDEVYGDEYAIMNMGVIGGTNALFQFECMTEYIGDGDVFVHAPEEMCEYQLMEDITAETRMFLTTESNYDLLSLVDWSPVSGFFTAFRQYNAVRSGYDELTYADYNDNYNEYGDICFYRADSDKYASYGLETCFDTDLVTEEGMGTLNGLYDDMQAKGATVYFSYAPINANALSDEEYSAKSWVTFHEKVEGYLDDDVLIISDAANYIMAGNYFYDTDYHLSTNGANVRTERLLEDIGAVLP